MIRTSLISRYQNCVDDFHGQIFSSHLCCHQDRSSTPPDHFLPNLTSTSILIAPGIQFLHKSTVQAATMVSYGPTGSETEPDHALENQQSAHMCQIQQMQKTLQQLQHPQQQTQMYSHPCRQHALQAWRNHPPEGTVASLAPNNTSDDARATQDLHMRRTYEILQMQRLQQQQQQLSQERVQPVLQPSHPTAPTWRNASPFSPVQEPPTTSSIPTGISRQPSHDLEDEAVRQMLQKQQMNILPHQQQQEQQATQALPQPEPFIPTQQDTPPHTPPHSNSHPNLYLLCPNERCKHENWYHQEGTESCCAYEDVTASPYPPTRSAEHKEKNPRDCDGDEEMVCDGDCDCACDEDESGNGGREDEIMVCVSVYFLFVEIGSSGPDYAPGCGDSCSC